MLGGVGLAQKVQRERPLVVVRLAGEQQPVGERDAARRRPPRRRCSRAASAAARVCMNGLFSTKSFCIGVVVTERFSAWTLASG